MKIKRDIGSMVEATWSARLRGGGSFTATQAAEAWCVSVNTARKYIGLLLVHELILERNFWHRPNIKARRYHATAEAIDAMEAYGLRLELPFYVAHFDDIEDGE